MNALLDQFSHLNILVAGDVMLDQYWFGDVSRISPEAPVPIVKIEKSDIRLGGAANVAANLAALQVKSTLLSVVGQDQAGHDLTKLAHQAGIQPLLHTDETLSTIVKLRVIGRGQQLLRIDFETAPSPQSLSAKQADFKKHLCQQHLVLLSDYGKGTLIHIDEMIHLCQQHHIPVFIDPKGDDYQKYAGASLITPNRMELKTIVGSWRNEEDLQNRAQNLRQALHLKALLVTRSEEGMSLFTEEEIIHQKAPKVREVFDVSGAGDTAIATLAAARAAGASWQESMQLATLAAGVVVGKLGTAIVTPEELRSLFEIKEK